LALSSTCTLPEQSRLPMGHGGGSRTSKDRYSPADMSASLPNAGWLSFHVRPHQREVCPLAGGVLSLTLNPYPVDYRPAFACSPFPYPLPCQVVLRLPFLRGSHRRATGLPRSAGGTPGGLGRVSSPVVRHLRRKSSEPPSLTTCLLAQACQHLWLVLCDDV
jgi:hypothetical protein